MLIVAMFTFAPPFLATILGIVAINDIRHSQGRLRGLGLAFVDALLFPALICIGIGIGITSAVIARLAPQLDGMMLLAAISALIVLPIMGLALRAI